MCKNINCKKTFNLLNDYNIFSPKIPLNKYLFILFLWVEKNFSYNIVKNSNISKSRFDRIKIIILKLITFEKKKKIKKISNLERDVQVDETIMIKGKLLTYTSKQKDCLKGATWLVGAVEEKTLNLKLEIVPNRKKETMKKIFIKNLNRDIKIKTDGHKSFPYAVNSINGKHIVVNHEIGFKNKEGQTTNLIENVWSLLKTDIKIRKGIQKICVPSYVEEFIGE